MGMRRILLTILSLGLLGSVPSQANDLILKNATLLNPGKQSVVRASLLIRKGLIEKIAKSLPETEGARVLNLQGKFVLPGLWDMHVHAWGNTNPQAGADPKRVQFLGFKGSAEAMLQCGVTGFLDLGAPVSIFRLREEQRFGDGEGADLCASGPMFTCPGCRYSDYGAMAGLVKDSEEARAALNDLAAQGPDVVKLVYDRSGKEKNMEPALMTALVAGARNRGLKVVAHVGTWQDVREVALAGVAAFTHVPPAPLPKGLGELLKKKKVVAIPALSAQVEFLGLVEDPKRLKDPLLSRVVSAEFLKDYGQPEKYEAKIKETLARRRALAAASRAALKDLVKAGVKVLAGSDASTPGCFQGYTLHRELENLKAAGLSNWQVLKAATTEAAAFLGSKQGLARGDEACLVVLDASPLEDIGNTRKIHMVIQHGKVIDLKE
jgi:imidazolonepropionase-like amidohydrolase